jgi:hypothetical protein
MPEMGSCPKCGIVIQVGKGPNGLAWHECRPRARVHESIAKLLATDGVLTEEQVRDVALRSLLATAAEDPSPSVLLELFRALQPKPDGRTLRGKGQAAEPGSKALLSFLSKGPVEEEG